MEKPDTNVVEKNKYPHTMISGYNKDVVVEWLECTTEDLRVARVTDDTHAVAASNVPQTGAAI